MARYDKYDPVGGGCRAPLHAAHAKTTPGNPIAVGLNASGRVVDGAGNTGIIGIMVLDSAREAGDIVDIMQDGEVVEMTGLTAGTVITADNTTGVLAVTAPAAGRTRVGFTVEASRLVARLGRVPGA